VALVRVAGLWLGSLLVLSLIIALYTRLQYPNTSLLTHWAFTILFFLPTWAFAAALGGPLLLVIWGLWRYHIPERILLRRNDI